MKKTTKSTKNIKRNEKRRLRYQTILALTNNVKLAQRARDMSNESYNKILGEYELKGKKTRYRLPEKKDNIKKLKKSKESIEIAGSSIEISKIDFEMLQELDLGKSKERYKVVYNVLRASGFTPREATKLKSKKLTYLADLVKTNKVLDREDRKNRWSSLSKKNRLDDDLIKLAEQVNIDQGFDATSRYGYGVVYAYYVNGGELEDYIVGLIPDLELPDIYYGMNKYNF